MEWKREMPTVPDLNGEAEEYFWVRGGNFNRPVMVRANNGVTSSLIDGKRAFRAEVNFTVVAENYPPHIWAGDLLRYPGANNWEWAGPVPRPAPNSSHNRFRVAPTTNTFHYPYLFADAGKMIRP